MIPLDVRANEIFNFLQTFQQVCYCFEYLEVFRLCCMGAVLVMIMECRHNLITTTSRWLEFRGIFSYDCRLRHIYRTHLLSANPPSLLRLLKGAAVRSRTNRSDGFRST